MKQLVVISGKGGTGKTVVTSAFAHIVQKKVMVDCDVDAADLHILLKPTIRERHIFMSGYEAMVAREKCVGCGACIRVCRFDAIQYEKQPGSKAAIDPIGCEGCGFCRIVCPHQAITMEERTVGEWFVSDTRYGTMVHAVLGVAEENSGKLVTQVRKKATEIAEKEQSDWVIIDGSPGIGCPVIASLSGVHAALIVTEPTRSGLHDAERVIQVARHFGVPVFMLINKYDLNERMTAQIELFCQDKTIPLVGKIAFDESVVSALTERKTIIEYGDSRTAREISSAWETLSSLVA